jgi:hypothetical protein
METIIDLLTGEKFVPNRVNQRFQNPKNRVLYYNKKAKKIRHMKSIYDKPLHKDYMILLELLDSKKEVVFSKDYLLGKGYSFGVYTHIENYNGKSCYAIYDFLIITLTNGDIKFIRNND